jgi:hypothetical protein
MRCPPSATGAALKSDDAAFAVGTAAKMTYHPGGALLLLDGMRDGAPGVATIPCSAYFGDRSFQEVKVHKCP